MKCIPIEETIRRMEVLDTTYFMTHVRLSIAFNGVEIDLAQRDNYARLKINSEDNS
jgi:hypothetical protein